MNYQNGVIESWSDGVMNKTTKDIFFSITPTLQYFAVPISV